MQIETYKSPYNSAGDVAASKWISYILRPEETGVLCPSPLMTDPRFEKAIEDLRTQQSNEFHSTVSAKSLEFWRTREIAEDDPKMSDKERKTLDRLRRQKHRILAQEANINDAGPVGTPRNVASHKRIHKLVHDLMLTQKYNFTGGETAGKMVQYQLPLSVLAGPDSEQKLIAAVKAVRDAFPPNIPLVLSIHFDRDPEKPNPHIHGWFHDREFDVEKGEWGKLSPITKSCEGLRNLHKRVDAAVLKAIGDSFGDQTKKYDPLRPVRTVFTKRQSYWVQAFRGKQDEFLKGDFLETIKSPHEREAMRQLVEARRYDVAKRQAKSALEREKENHWFEMKKVMQETKSQRLENQRMVQDIEDITSTMASALNPSPELERMYKPKDGKPAFTPTPGYYKTRQYHSRLTATVTEHFDQKSDIEKVAEMKSIRASIAKIDDQLKSDNSLTAAQRKSLEFTRDFEVKSLRYLKSQLPQQQPKPESTTKLK